MSAVIHLVRHGEVENPKGIIYGRLPGYHLSERGRRQARQSAERLQDADVAFVWASPLERAQETAELIAEPHGVEVGTDERLLESETVLEGLTRNASHFLRSPLKWRHFRNPMTPSWGEPFSDIRERMTAVIKEAATQAEGREAVLVSHQTPVLVARLSLTRRRQPPWLGLTPCQTGSITTLRMDPEGAVVTSYFSPAG